MKQIKIINNKNLFYHQVNYNKIPCSIHNSFLLFLQYHNIAEYYNNVGCPYCAFANRNKHKLSPSVNNLKKIIYRYDLS